MSQSKIKTPCRTNIGSIERRSAEDGSRSGYEKKVRVLPIDSRDRTC
jgi:hypothetical protein